MSFSPGALPVPQGHFRYVDRYLLGEGGLGIVQAVEVVASASSHKVGTMLACKKLNAKWAADPAACARFEREIEMLDTMSHRNIVTLEGVSLPGNERAYLMPLYPDTLRAELSRGEVRPLRATIDRAIKIADALAYAHSLNFLHRDVKPDNILLDRVGEPIVSDWGVGGFIHQHSKVLDLTKAGLGTQYYCSLEQWSNDPAVDGRTDVYSLGMMLAEMVPLCANVT